jgi:hypothetical protein
MKTVDVLVVDGAAADVDGLGRQFGADPSRRFALARVPANEFGEKHLTKGLRCDVVLITEHVGNSTAARVARLLRQRGGMMPILKLTKVSEAELPPKLAQSGVSGMLNLADLRSPIFTWTLTSLLRWPASTSKLPGSKSWVERSQRNLMQIATISYRVNNELAALRLAAFRLEKMLRRSPEQKKYFDLLNRKLAKIEEQIRRIQSACEGAVEHQAAHVCSAENNNPS